jgi:hypothetical protein
MNTKATLYLDAGLYRALKVQAALSDRTVSETANALLSRGLAADRTRAKPSRKVELRSEGKMGYPVLVGLKPWPKGYVFDRGELYD